MMQERELLDAITVIARQAGEKIMVHFRGTRQATEKADRSPVTDADLEANRFIMAELLRLAPDIPIISEEDEQISTLTPSARYWLVDPLDGTRSFVSGEGEFTVNIGLIENSYPVMGAIHLPRSDVLYYGAKGIGAFRRNAKEEAVPIRARNTPSDGVDVVKSSHHPSKRVEAFLSRLQVRSEKAASSSVKFCVVAEGQADVYPRFGTTMEWDTAAGQAIVEAAGGRVEFEDGARFSYGKPTFTNPPFIVYGA
jgi:3'(2'), 5'-bisphosphate nucleotidase